MSFGGWVFGRYPVILVGKQKPANERIRRK
jgi:hypothetical protein